MNTKNILLIFLFVAVVFTPRSAYLQESSFLEDVLIKFNNFEIQNSTENVFFYPDKAFKITAKGSNGSVNGTFNIEFITIGKGKTKHNPDEDMTFTILNYVLPTGNKEVWVFKEGLVKVEDNVVYLPFIRLNDGFDSPTIMMVHTINTNPNWSSFSWTDIVSGSRFLSTIDFTARAFVGFIIEDALKQPTQEDALQYALDQLLDFSDDEREMYGEIIKQVIIEKYRSRN